MGEIRHAKTCSLGATTEANVKLNKCCAATCLYRLNSSSSTTALCPKYQARLRTPTYIATCLKFGQPLISHRNDFIDIDHEDNRFDTGFRIHHGLRVFTPRQDCFSACSS